MTFALPHVGPRSITPRLISTGADMPGGIGPDQRFMTAGADRYALDFKYPPMTRGQAEALIGALLRASREEVTATVPQPGLVVGAPGARAIGADVSSGATVLPVDGAAGYVVRSLQFFNVVAPDGRRYLHATTQANVIAGNIVIAPALRIIGTAGLVLDFVNPVIQGFVQGRETPWSVDEARHYGVAFTVKERK